MRCSAVPSVTCATCPRRISCPSRSATTMFSNSAGVASRPLRRIERSSSAPFTFPTGAARFCSCNACTTCDTPTPAACNASGLSSTVSSRSSLPGIVTSATPPIDRNSREIPGSASRVSSAGVSVDELSASDTMGRSVSLNFLMIGSSSSVGRSCRMLEIASRMSCVASVSGLSKRNSTVMKPKPSSARPFTCFTPAIEEIASSIGSSSSRSTPSGDAPG